MLGLARIDYGLKCVHCNCFPDAARFKMSLFTNNGTEDEELKKPNSTSSGDKSGGAGPGGSSGVICQACMLASSSSSADAANADVVLCSTCTAGYHLACCRPALAKKPAGHWRCEVCDREEEQERIAARYADLPTCLFFSTSRPSPD
eukprot:1595811-Rhodomonas_salina.1